MSVGNSNTTTARWAPLGCSKTNTVSSKMESSGYMSMHRTQGNGHKPHQPMCELEFGNSEKHKLR